MTPADPPELTPPPPPPSPHPPDDSIGKGVGLAMLWQLGAIVVSAITFFTAWGLIQWFALVPVYLKRKRAGYVLAAKGILIAGFVGMLLNFTCAALILGNLNFR
jgi:hypothetical protein